MTSAALPPRTDLAELTDLGIDQYRSFDFQDLDLECLLNLDN
jgi:hypothetical protein